MSTGQFFAFLEPAEESALLAAAPLKTFQRGDVVLGHNVALRAIFVIDRGSVQIERPDGAKMAPLALLARGDLFGEMSFVDGERTSGRAVAREPTDVRVIDPGIIDSMSDVDPTFGSRLYRSIAAIVVKRLRTTSLDRYM